MKKISERVQKIEISGIRKAFALAGEIKNPINLSIGQPDFDVPEPIKEGAIKAIKSGFNHYTPTKGLVELREKISHRLFKKNSIKASAEEIVITSGTSGAIFLALSVLLNPSDEVIIFDPYFVAYKEMVKFLDAQPVFVSTFPNFQPDIKKLQKAITLKTKLIILNSPNNPTGAVYPQELIRKIVEVARKKDLYIISDEVYEDFIYEGKHFSPGSIYQKTITLNGFSKSASMTGWRIGYAAGPKGIIDEMCKLQQFLYVCAPSFAQRAAITALEYNSQEKIKEYRVKRDIIYDGLKSKYDIVKPEGAFYAFVKTPKNEDIFIQELIKHNVIVTSGSAFSQKSGYIRISFATSNDKLEKAVEIFQKLSH